MNRNKTFLKNKTLLVTGGTGSFGKKFVETLLINYKSIKKIIIFSRDELKQFEMEQDLGKNKKLRFFLGDLRDKDRIYRALDDVDIVVHAAALMVSYDCNSCIVRPLY